MAAVFALGCGIFGDGDVGVGVGDDYGYASTPPPVTAAPTQAGTGSAGVDVATIDVVPVVSPDRRSLRVSGTGFGANEAIVIELDGLAAGLATTDGSGSFAGVFVQLPGGGTAGTTYAVRAAGGTSRRTATKMVTV